jgi:pimeloyl-ACP methyl ester carboxylesterase
MSTVDPSSKWDGFKRDVVAVNGIDTVVYSIGEGPPLVFLHGAGTFTGFEFLKAFAEKHTVYIPYHPGYGESASDETIDAIGDYVLHYIELFQLLGLSTIDLMGFSLGGWIAAEFAIVRSDLLRTLVLVAPGGLVVLSDPAPDLFTIPPQELPGYLAFDPSNALRYFPKGPDPAFETLIGREMGSTARVLASNNQGNPKLARWLHLIKAPTMVLWGAEDRLRPHAQAKEWLRLIPDSRLISLPGTGHLVFEENPNAAIMSVSEFLTDRA